MQLAHAACANWITGQVKSSFPHNSPLIMQLFFTTCWWALIGLLYILTSLWAPRRVRFNLVSPAAWIIAVPLFWSRDGFLPTTALKQGRQRQSCCQEKSFIFWELIFLTCRRKAGTGVWWVIRIYWLQAYEKLDISFDIKYSLWGIFVTESCCEVAIDAFCPRLQVNHPNLFISQCFYVEDFFNPEELQFKGLHADSVVQNFARSTATVMLGWWGMSVISDQFYSPSSVPPSVSFIRCRICIVSLLAHISSSPTLVEILLLSWVWVTVC